LDGELWCGHKSLPKLTGLIITTRNKNRIEHYDVTDELIASWDDVKFLVFDAPLQRGNYEERHMFLTNLVLHGEHIQIVHKWTCKGNYHLLEVLQEIERNGGEGLIIRDPLSPYTSGRCNSVLKVKNYQDTEVKMTKKSTSSYSLICLQKNGITCRVKCSSFDYLHPPEPDTVLTVRHTGYFKSGKLKYPFLTVSRVDVTWQNVLDNEIS